MIFKSPGKESPALSSSKQSSAAHSTISASRDSLLSKKCSDLKLESAGFFRSASDRHSMRKVNVHLKNSEF